MRRHRPGGVFWLWIALGLGLALAGAPASAIVNIEDQRDEAAPGLAARIEASLGGASGNTDKLNLRLGTHLRWNRGQAAELLLLDYAYGESNDVRDTNRAFIHLRHTARISARRALEGFAQLEEDEFTRLSFRGLLGGGLRLTLQDSERARGHLGLGVFAVRETLEAAAGLTDAGTRDFWRANLYLALHRVLNGHTRVVNTAYYQPALDDLRDFRLLDEAALKVQLSRGLDLSVTLEIAHDSRPPQTVKETDLRFGTGIEYRF